MANSYRRRILNYLRDTTLVAINTGSGYNTTPATIKRGLLEKDALPDSAFPALFLSRCPEERNNLTVNQFKATMQVAIVGYVKNSTGIDSIQQDLDDLIEDVSEALEQDRTLGGLSKWLEVKAIGTDDGDLAPHGVCVITVEIVYVTEGVTA